MSNKRKILVTGADGFVGAHLLRELARDGNQVEIRTLRYHGPSDGCAFHADITDEAAVERVIEAYVPDVVYHLAGYASVAQSIGGAEQSWRVNFGGTFNIAAVLARHAPRATMLHVSTSEVYGLSFNDGVVTEDTPLRPANAYARAKAAAEAMLGDIYSPDGKLIVVRPFNHTGSGQDERFVVPSFAAQILRSKAEGTGEMVVGNLDAAREFLDVRDVVRAYRLLVATAASLPRRSCFNVASAQPQRIGDILARLQALAGWQPKVTVDPARLRPSDIAVASGSAQRLYDATGWTPEIALDETLSDVLSGFRSS
jgi:GDP-4-dehydro-6-deoxy-D-mannose reductase